VGTGVGGSVGGCVGTGGGTVAVDMGEFVPLCWYYLWFVLKHQGIQTEEFNFITKGANLELYVFMCVKILGKVFCLKFSFELCDVFNQFN
jgi:hypothetical protein